MVNSIHTKQAMCQPKFENRMLRTMVLLAQLLLLCFDVMFIED